MGGGYNPSKTSLLSRPLIKKKGLVTIECFQGCVKSSRIGFEHAMMTSSWHCSYYLIVQSWYSWSAQPRGNSPSKASLVPRPHPLMKKKALVTHDWVFWIELMWAPDLSRQYSTIELLILPALFVSISHHLPRKMWDTGMKHLPPYCLHVDDVPPWCPSLQRRHISVSMYVR